VLRHRRRLPVRLPRRASCPAGLHFIAGALPGRGCTLTVHRRNVNPAPPGTASNGDVATRGRSRRAGVGVL